MKTRPFTVIDLFSGGGGMSCGFHRHKSFQIIGAADAQIGKPSSGHGSLDCNSTYELNMGVRPLEVDLSAISPEDLFHRMGKVSPDVLIACAPCTGFSRTMATNHLRDDPRNSLVTKTAEFVRAFKPKVLLMENARELLRGNYTHHFAALRASLHSQGYAVHAQNHFLSSFGLPQKRERALVIAVKESHRLRTLEELWRGYSVTPEAINVRAAIGHLPRIRGGEQHPTDPFHVCPNQGAEMVLRLKAVPKNGGSWIALRNHPDHARLMTPAMKKIVAKGDFGTHPDVYGRLWWDRPAVTIKRECGHVGNGRYAHPEQDRLCSVREMALLQGFPADYVFGGSSLSNMYRHIGDAVPPLIAFQIAAVCKWILTGKQPNLKDAILPGCNLKSGNLVPLAHQQYFDLAGAA